MSGFIGPILGGIGHLFTGGSGLGSNLTRVLGGGLGGMLGGQGSYSRTPTFTPDQSGIQQQLYQSLSDRLAHPGVELDPLKTQAYGGVNRNFQGLNDRLTSQFASRGFGRGGNLATNQTQLELARQGDLGDIESRFAGYGIDQDNRNLDMASRFGFADPGFKGQQSGANNPLSGFLGGALRGLGGVFGAQQTANGGDPNADFSGD